MGKKYYTVEETQEIKDVFSKENNLEERLSLCKKLNKTMDVLLSKYYYINNYKYKKKKKRVHANNIFSYTSDEERLILETFNTKGNSINKKALAKKLNRTIAALYTKNSLLLKDNPARKEPIVTHVTQTIERHPAKISVSPIIIIGESKIIIPTSKFTINGITIEC